MRPYHPTERLTAMVTGKCTSDEKATIQSAARVRGVTMSVFVREALIIRLKSMGLLEPEDDVQP